MKTRSARPVPKSAREYLKYIGALGGLTSRRGLTAEQARKRIEGLSKSIDDHNYRYYVESSPSISDYEFDMLMEELIRLEKEYPQARFKFWVLGAAWK